MASSNRRGTVGIVRPTTRAGGFEDLIRMLPEGARGGNAVMKAVAAMLAAFKTMGVNDAIRGHGRLLASLASPS